MLSMLAILGFSAWFLGKNLLPKSFDFEHPGIHLAACGALGMMILSSGLYLLIHTVGISTGSLMATYFCLMVLAMMGIAVMRKKIHGMPIPWKPHIAAAALLGSYHFWIFLSAILPALSVDELVYHLAIPKQILLQGHWVSFPNNIYAYFPQLAENLFVLTLGMMGEFGARMIHSLWGFFLAIALYGFSRQTLSRRESWFVVFLFMTLPSVMVIQAWAYVDLAYTLYTFLALILLSRSYDQSSWKMMAVAGLMAGGAFAVKYTGLQYSLLLGIVLLCWIAREKKFPSKVGCIAFFPLVFLPVMPYLFRNWSETGWPLFPFYVPGFILKPGMNWDFERARLYLTWLGQFGAPLGQEKIWHSLLSPIFVFIMARFDSIPWYDGILGPVFLSLPFLMAILWKEEKNKRWLVFSAVFFYYWASTTKQIRFLLPVMPILCFLVVRGFAFFRKPWIWGLLSLYLLIMTGVGASSVLRLEPMNYWAGKESRAEYLSKRMSNYGIYQKANQLLKEGDHLAILNMKNYGYFLNAPYDSDFIFERWNLDHWLVSHPTPEQIYQYFKKRSVTHLMLDEAFQASPDWGIEPEVYPDWQSFLAAFAEKVYSEGRYSLYALKS